MKKMLFVILIAILLATSSTVSALQVYLTETNEPSLGSAKFALVELSIKDNHALFSVDPLEGAFDGTLSNWGVQEFWFNTDIDYLTSDDFTFPDVDDWDVYIDYAKPIGGAGSFGKFIVKYAGSGDRMDPLTFTINNTRTDVWAEEDFYLLNDAGYHFAAHIADFTVDGESFTSAKFADGPLPIPEPAGVLLLGTGLIVLAGIVRKKLLTS